MFIPGETVGLISGGPLMTVSSSDFGVVEVVWINEEGNLQKEKLPWEALEKKSPLDKGGKN